MTRTVGPVITAGSWAAGPQPTIDKGGLLLRPFDHADAPAVLAAFSTEDIRRWHTRAMDTTDQAHAWIDEQALAWLAETGVTWAIVELGAVVGRVSFHLVLGEGRGEVAYWLLPRGRGHGVATRAVAAATAWAHVAGLWRIELQHASGNESSRRVAERAGYTREGVRRAAHLHADGWHDMVLYAHLASD